MITIYRYDQWNAALQCLSVLDVLMSLAKFNQAADGEVCRPEVVPLDDEAEVKFFTMLFIKVGHNDYVDDSMIP